MSVYKHLLIFATGCLMTIALSPPLQAQSYITRSGYAEFESSAPLLTFTGTSENLNGLINLDENLVDFYLDLNTLETGINRRDRDMRTQYLETEDYPFAEFTGSLSSEFDPGLREAQQVTVEGTFTLHGVKKEVVIDGTLTPDADNAIQLEANWTVLLSDYNIERPSIVFYQLADEQKVSISANLEADSQED